MPSPSSLILGPEKVRAFKTAAKLAFIGHIIVKKCFWATKRIVACVHFYKGNGTPQSPSWVAAFDEDASLTKVRSGSSKVVETNTSS